MTDTQSDIVAPNPRHRWWAVPLTVLAFGVIVAVGVTSLVPASAVADKDVDASEQRTVREATPYAVTPGGAQSVDDRVVLNDLPGDVEVFPPDSDVFFVTISEPAQSVLSWFVGGDEPAVDWLTEFEKYGGSTPQQRRQQSLQQMATSEEVAKFVALASVGYDAKRISLGLEVNALVCLAPDGDGGCARTAPSAEVLEPGDVIVAAEGQDVMSTCDLTIAMRGSRPGDEISLTVRRDDSEREVSVELVADPSTPRRPIVGFVPHEPFDVELPFELDIETGKIGGPSAGAAFTLTLIDELTAGDLLGDDVAVTGTISVDGRIGQIGGLVQKAEAVRQAGVDTFLVPEGQSGLEAARELVGDDMEIIPVATLGEALEVLEARGGDPIDVSPLPRCGS